MNTIKVKLVRDIKKYNTDMNKFKNKVNEFFIDNETNTLFYCTNNIRKKEDWRDIGFNIVKTINKNLNNISTIDILDKVDSNSSQFIEGLYLATYDFSKYKRKTNKKRVQLKFLFNYDKGNSSVISTAKNKVLGQFRTRDIINTCPEDANPESISLLIKERFSDNKDITVTIYNKDDLEKLNMRGHLAVNRGSKFNPKLVKIEYTPKKFKKHIVAIGKGLTYDSGGLDIKPTMKSMKADKSGAITLYGVMDIISKEQSNNKVTFYLPFAENMISENSYRSDDIIIMKNNVSVHVHNTDAEGRIVLHDSITLAQDENPNCDVIVSIATLTGSAVVQFGNEAAGVVTHNKKLLKKIKKIGIVEDEIFCNAELHKFMLDGIKDDIADISNTGTKHQGCQKAGLFLMTAINKKNIKKYIHLDIAGPAFIDNEFGTNVKGATGFGVRTLFEFVK
jgi:leucyl aminopeptidase